MTLLQQTILIRASNPGMNFDAAWQQACSMQRVTGSFGRPTKSGDAVLVAEASGLGVHPKLKTELNRHKALEQSRTSSGTMNHVKRLAKIRQMMEADPSLSFDAAFSRIVQEENNASPPLKTSQTAPHGNGKLILIEGAHCGLFCKLLV
jgi:hypothetical protein